MKAGIIFSENVPVISIYGLEGAIMLLWGRTEYIVSKDAMHDTLSTWFNFFIEQRDNGWRFDYRSNSKYSRDEDKGVIDRLLSKANKAITQEKETDLSQEFNALNAIEPYTFGGLFARMNERYIPIFENKDGNQALAEMREKLRHSMRRDEIESDEHLKNFIFQTPLETIRVDDTPDTE